VGVLLLGVAALGYYRQSLSLLPFDRPEHNLVTPEEQSLQLIKLGEDDYELGNYEGAIARSNAALALTHSLPAYWLLGRSLRDTGRIDEALGAYTKALQLDRRNLEVRWAFAELQRARGNWPEAYQEYKRIIALDSQSAQAVAALLMIEDHERQTRQPQDRQPLIPIYYETKRPTSPDLPSVAVGTGPLAVAPSTSPDASITAPPEPWKKKPEDEAAERRVMAALHKDRGNRFFRAGIYMAAITDFKSALRLTPEDKDLYYFLGSTYRRAGQDALAHEAYKQCDSGQYAGVCRSGAQQTAKAARNAIRQQEKSSELGIGLPQPTLRTTEKK
jgi:tetratricopeptide (TPR) repeat protein